MILGRVWSWIWSWVGAVPVRWKVIGIVVASQLVVGLSIAWWVRTSLGQWLSYLLSEDKVLLAMEAGMRGVLVVTGMAAAAGLLLAWLLTIILTAPILDLARRAHRVADGDLSARAPVWARDEMGYLAHSFNTMVDTLAASQADLVKSHAELSTSNEELRRLCDDLGQKEKARIGLLGRVVTAQEEERQRLSRELHDGAGQMLASLLVHLKLVERSQELAEVRSRTAELRELVVKTLEEMRGLAVDLRPAGLDDRGLAGALEWQAGNLRRNAGLQVELRIDDAVGRLAGPVETQLYRIAQEMLANVARHSRASRVRVELLQGEGWLRLRVEDDGIGFDRSAGSDSGSGLGLLTMQERAALLGGTFQLRSSPGRGTVVEVAIPSSQEAAP